MQLYTALLVVIYRVLVGNHGQQNRKGGFIVFKKPKKAPTKQQKTEMRVLTVECEISLLNRE